jgi:hypothetical protein
MRSSLRNPRFLLALLFIVILRALDLFITFRFTPNLAAEINPVVSVFGASWVGLIAFQILLVAFIAFLMHRYFTRETPAIADKNLSYYNFVYVYFFGKLQPWPKRFFSFPKNFKRHLALNGFLLMILAIGISLFAIVHNLLLLARVEWYAQFVIDHFKVYFPVVFIVAAVGAFNLFCVIEYRKYKSKA